MAKRRRIEKKRRKLRIVRGFRARWYNRTREMQLQYLKEWREMMRRIGAHPFYAGDEK